MLRALEDDLAVRLGLQTAFNPSVLTYRVPLLTHPIPSETRHLLWDRFESPLAYLLWCSVTDQPAGTRLDDRQGRRLAARFTTLGLFELVRPRVWRRCTLTTAALDRIARTMPDRKTSIKARLMTARRKKAAKAPLKHLAARVVELNVFRDLPESIRKARLQRLPDQAFKAKARSILPREPREPIPTDAYPVTHILTEFGETIIYDKPGQALIEANFEIDERAEEAEVITRRRLWAKEQKFEADCNAHRYIAEQ